MNWITTNIRFPEDDYMELKMTAAMSRKSIAEIVRERVRSNKQDIQKEKSIKLLQEMQEVAKENAKIMKGKSLSKLLIEMRYEQ